MANDSNETERERRIRENTEKQRTALAAQKHADEGTGFVVAEGKSITTRRGVIDAGSPIGPLDFVRRRSDIEDGRKQLEVRKEQGYIVPARKKPEPKPTEASTEPNDDGKGSDDGKGTKPGKK